MCLFVDLYNWRQLVRYVICDCHIINLDALFDGRGNVVETDGALEEDEELTGVHGPQLKGRLLNQQLLHPDEIKQEVN